MRTLGQLSGLAVIGEGSGEKLGRIHDILFDPKSGQITAFLIHPGGLLAKPRVLPRLFVRTLGTDALLVEPGNVLEDSKAEPAVPGSLSVLSLGGRPVLDDTGKYLGKFDDVVVDESTLTVTTLQISAGLIENTLHGKPSVLLSVVKAIGPDSIVVPATAEAAPASANP